MHKRIPLVRLLFLFVLLSTLLHPASANAARGDGNEQPTASSRPVDIPRTHITPEIGYVYTVVAGDDVWLIAVAHGLQMDALARANKLEPPYLIHPGDKLWVPAARAVVKQPPTPTPRPKVTPTPVPTPEPAPAAAITATVAAPVEPAPTPTPEPAAVAAAPGLSEPAALILSLINERRTAAGLSALTWSAELTVAAQAHAEDCAQRGWGSHVGSDGARLRTRLARANYYGSWVGENWANYYTASQSFEMWYSEGPGGPHYENIMNPYFTEVGIGIAAGGWGYYFITDFGAP